jgi:hypothetical protein
MQENDTYPALRALFKRAFSGGGVRKAMERISAVSGDEAARVGAEIRALLASAGSEKAVGRALAGLGCEYDPRSQGGTAKGWLEALKGHCEAKQSRVKPAAGGEGPGEAFRLALVAEIARIGADELSVRTMVEPAMLLRAARGEPVDKAARRALSVYEFRPYPDLRRLLGGYFYEAWDDFSGSWQEVVDGFAAGARPGELRGTLVDIEGLLQTDDAAFDRAMSAIDGNHIPTAPAGRRAWLAEVRDRILTHVTG